MLYLYLQSKMFFIQSERLKLMPLTHQQLLLYKSNRPLLEKQLDLTPSVIQLSPTFKRELDSALHNFWLPNTLLYPNLYQWYTNWLIILKSSSTAIGGIGFAGYPDDRGVTRLGYHISSEHCGNGYASEALSKLLQWGFDFSLLKVIKADTTRKNAASKRVLIKAGFKQTHADGNTLFYTLHKPL